MTTMKAKIHAPTPSTKSKRHSPRSRKIAGVQNQLKQRASLPLFLHISIFAILAVVVSSLSYTFLNFFFPIAVTESKIPLLHEAFLSAGGLGAIIYLVIAYRKQSIFEQKYSDSHFDKAVEALHSQNTLEQALGIRNIEALANTQPEKYAESAATALCELLRISQDTERHPEIERLVLRTLRSHLREDCSPRHSWSRFDMDLHGVTFTQKVNLSGCCIKMMVLTDCIFKDDLDASKTQFEKANFLNARFQGIADFESTTFKQCIRFGTTVKRSKLYDAELSDEMSDSKDTEIAPTFQSSAIFSNTTFEADCIFGKGKPASITDGREATWLTRFARTPLFNGVTFSGKCSFENCQFDMGATFSTRTVNNETQTTIFEDKAVFLNCRIGTTLQANIESHLLPTLISFRGARFRGSININLELAIPNRIDLESSGKTLSSTPADVRESIPLDESETYVLDELGSDFTTEDHTCSNASVSDRSQGLHTHSASTDSISSTLNLVDFTSSEMECSQHRRDGIVYEWGTLAVKNDLTPVNQIQDGDIPSGARCAHCNPPS